MADEVLPPYTFFRTTAYRWSDIGRFSAVVQGYRLSTTWAVFKISHGPRAGRRVVVMPYAAKGKSGDELVEYLNAWRHAALEVRRHPAGRDAGR